MKGEKLVSVGPYGVQHEGLQTLIDTFKEDKQTIVATANTVAEVDKLKEKEVKPTVAIVHDFSDFDDTLRAVDHLKEVFPEVVVVTWGVDRLIEKADYQLGIWAGRKEIKELLLEIQH